MEQPTATPSALTPAFLAGGGHAGALIRAFDWAATPLGPPRHWPVPLRTALRILLTTNHPVFVFWGPQLHCFYNDAYSRSLGPEKHPSMLGATGAAAWEEIWPIIGPQIEHVMAGRGATWNENQLVPITRHGRREDVYWTYSYSPIDDAEFASGVGGVLVLCTETTEQVRAAGRLRSADIRWRALFDQAPGFMCLLRGPQHVLEFGNPAYFELFADRDFSGEPVGEALPWTREQGFIDLLDDVYRSGKAYTVRAAPVVVRGAGAEPLYLDFVYQPIRDEQGQVTGIFVLGTDASEREHARLAIHDSAERLRIACEAAGLGIHDYNVVDNSVRWDARVRELWGAGAEEVITYEVFDAGLHPDDRAPTRAQIEAAFDPAGDGRFTAEYRVIHRIDGHTRWVLATGRAGFERGRAVRLVGTVQDITERKEADTRRNEFLATLGHELRNPLAPISNAVHMLKLQPAANAHVRSAHDVIERQLAQIVRLIDDLLDVVRVTRGRFELRTDTVALAAVLEQAMETAAPVVARSGHVVIVPALPTPVPSTPVMLHADAVRLAQVFSNLLINACKYSDAGSRIEVAVTQPQAGRVQVRVIDEGIGLDARHLHRVFDMFSQAQTSLDRSQGGLGIGLSLAKGLVEMHGGSIRAHSAGLGHGSEFVVELPTVDAAASTAVPSARDTRPRAPMADRRVLVIDDNPDSTHTLAELLRSLGASVETAGDGLQALAVAERMQPTSVLLDIGLPGMNGYDVCRALRRHDWGAGLQIVALTGWGQPADKALAEQAGFDAHLVKPVDFDHLLRLIGTHRRAA